MWADIRQKQDAMAKPYYSTQRHTIQADYIPTMDELAQLVGCKPNIGG
jgi:dimethylaniline monooxygenase (N-oxide forming)